MKLLAKNIDKDLSGSVTLIGEDDEDMWQIYNLIQRGDEVRSLSDRKVISVTATGSSQSKRKQLNITIRVEKMAFSARPDEADDEIAKGSSSEWTSIRLSGPITNEDEDLKVGAYHTLELVPERKFTLIKGPDAWDSFALEKLDEIAQPAARASIGAILCGEGVANICVVTKNTTIVRQRIAVPIPKKAGAYVATAIEKASHRYLSQVYEGLQRHLDLTNLKVIIIASPAFYKDALYNYIMQRATQEGNKNILTAKPKFLLAHAPSAHVHVMPSVLTNPQVANRIEEFQFGRDAKLLDQFYKMLNDDPDRAWYGPDHVHKAAERAAIDHLLISDKLLRSSKVEERKQWLNLIEYVKQLGGSVHIFSGLQQSGKQLEELTGVAALLRYPLSLESVEADEEEDANQNSNS